MVDISVVSAGSATTVKAENSVPSNNEAGKQDQSIGL